MPAITNLPWTHLKKSAKKQPRKNDKIVWLIGGAKIFYGVLLLGAGIGAVNLIGKNVSAELWRLTERWNIDFHNHFVQLLFHQTAQMDGRRLFFITLLTFGYAALFFVEGTGLILGKYWAKWLVIIDTASFIPGEIYYLIRQFNWFDAALLFVNAAVVAYLVWRIKTRDHPVKKRTRR
jgi:uncharacterized membrane protein (DUF2068 family)